ncbi:MAG: hypothetical protein WA160_15690 [Pseudobdellovibrio sp.]
MKSLFLSLVATLVLTPQLLFANPVPGLLGKWDAERVLLGRGVQFHLTFDFTETQTELTVHCLFTDGTHLSSSANSSVVYNVNEIFLQESKQVITDDGVHFCRATLSPTKWTAYFNGAGKMVLFVPAPYQAQFDLIPHIAYPNSVL